MIKVGLTGGIGSGKTTVAKIFSTLGVPIYFADDRTKELMNLNSNLKNKLIQTFGKEIYTKTELNRKALAKIIFNNNKAIEKINSIVHPVVKDDFLKWLSDKSKYAYVIEEAAILFETGHYKGFDKIITVIAPLNIRKERIIKRDKTTEQEINKRMSNQWNDEQKIALSDYIINNDDTEMIIPQVLNIHKKLNNILQ